MKLKPLYVSCLDLLRVGPRSRARHAIISSWETRGLIPRTRRTHRIDGPVALGGEARGFRGRITGIATGLGGGLPPDELERRLIELGIVEGAQVEILHEGLFSRDPIALRVDTTTVALRRQEALAILVRPE
jgi:ferrous iron transport protein A